MSWKQIPWSDEVATLSEEIPVAVDGSVGSAGVGDQASKDDHVHALGHVTWENGKLFYVMPNR